MIRAEEFRPWNLPQYEQAWAGPAPESLEEGKTCRVLLTDDEAGSCEEATIHPKYVRFFQEEDFEQVLARFTQDRCRQIESAKQD